VDVNGDPVNVDSVVEDLQSIYGPVGNAGLWCTGGCTGVLANGSFVDNVAMMPDLSTIGGFESIQTFSVLTGGLSYQLSTQIVIQGVWFGSTAALVATVQRP
jgi:hypothetical protein